MPEIDPKKLKRAKYYSENRDRIREYQKKYRLSLGDKWNSRNQEWRKNNERLNKQINASWRTRNHARAMRNQGRWASKNKLRVKAIKSQSRKKHRDNDMAISMRYRARKNGSPGWEYTTPEHVAGRWEMFGNLCWICKSPAEATDHVKPLSKGGCHFPSNLRPICRKCNSGKGSKWLKNGITTTILTLSFANGRRI